MKLAWATDIHLDFITNPERLDASSRNLDIFCSLLTQNRPEAVILSGDISTSKFLVDHLAALDTRINAPIYFVLGNHDFWLGGIESVRQRATQVSNASERLKYLSAMPYSMLAPSVAIVGHDGWYDGHNGNPYDTRFNMNDWYRIADFVDAGAINEMYMKPNIDVVLNVARTQANKAAQHISSGIRSALSQQKVKKIIVVTHVPPFVNPLDLASTPGPELYPWYSSKTMGVMLTAAAKANPEVMFEVFCGHVHTGYEGRILPNLLLRSGTAEYASPSSQGLYDIL